MRNIALRIVLAVLLSVVGLSATARRVAGEKVGAAFESTVYEFGNVFDNAEPVVHNFVITNTGTHALAILSVKPTCGCTVGDYSRKPIKPGESAPITIKFNPSGQRGEVNKDIRVQLKNGAGKSERITLRLIGTVSPAK